jgi:hypothetical protein
MIQGALVGVQGIEDKLASDARSLLGAQSIRTLMEKKKLVISLEDKT